MLLMLRLLDFMDLDGYNSLFDKYRDEGRDIYRIERHWVNENYSAVFGDMFRHMNFRKCIEMRRTKRTKDYLALYYIMQQYLEELDADE